MAQKKKITIDKLAQMTAKGFIEVDKKIEATRLELKREMSELKTELRGEMSELRETVEKSADKMLIAADQMAGQFNT